MVYSLGRLVQHDVRSLAFPAETAPLKTVTHRLSGPVLDQGDIGSCTGNAMAQALNTTPLRHGRPLLTESAAIRLYSRATEIDGFPGTFPPDDSGSSGLAVAKAAQEAKLISAYHHAFGIDQALGAIVLSAVILGIDWTNDMFTPDRAGYIHPTGSVAGGHEIAIIGINTRLERVTLLNSWGPSWGRNGRAYLKFADLDALLRAQGDVVVPVL